MGSIPSQLVVCVHKNIKKVKKNKYFTSRPNSFECGGSDGSRLITTGFESRSKVKANEKNEQSKHISMLINIKLCTIVTLFEELNLVLIR